MSAGAELHRLTVFTADRLAEALASAGPLDRWVHDSAYGTGAAIQFARIVHDIGLAEGVLRMLAAGMLPDLPAPQPERQRDGRGRYVKGETQT